MRRCQKNMIAVTLLLCTAGCGDSTSKKASTPAAPPDATEGTIQIEPLYEAATVFNQLGQIAWVYKHRGGDLTTEFNIYHRPAGKGQTEKAIYTAVSDGVLQDAIIVRKVRKDEPEPQEGFTRHREEGGYIIVAFPDDPGSVGTITYFVSLDGCSVRSRKLTERIFSETGFSIRTDKRLLGKTGFGFEDNSMELKVGETAVLGEVAVTISPDEKLRAPRDERETVRYVLTATAVKDGQLPKRAAADASQGMTTDKSE